MTVKNELVLKNKGRRGPAPSGESRAEIERRSKLKLREKQADEGLVSIKAVVKEATRDELAALKSMWQVDNIGQVIERMLADYKK